MDLDRSNTEDDCSNQTSSLPLISVIICVRNSEQWLLECLNSVSSQSYDGPLEVSIFDDGSSDSSVSLINKWFDIVKQNNNRRRISMVISSSGFDEPAGGVGYAKNRAIEQSTGKFLCFLDSDDVAEPTRIAKQYDVCRTDPGSIVGAKVRRIPPDSTPRYINWANSLTPDQLSLQIYTCFGPTILMPTWFCSRETFNHVDGGFDQSCSKGVPEDLIFFYRHLRLGGTVRRVDDILLTYRYHPHATTFSVTDSTIWNVRLAQLDTDILQSKQWNQFSIWNAGKEGRRFYRSLSRGNRRKVVAFCDVDPKKLAKKWYTYEMCDDSDCDGGKEDNRNKPRVPIVHYSDVKPPIVICVKLGLTEGKFEKNLQSLNLREGEDYVHFG